MNPALTVSIGAVDAHHATALVPSLGTMTINESAATLRLSSDDPTGSEHTSLHPYITVFANPRLRVPFPGGVSAINYGFLGVIIEWSGLHCCYWFRLCH